VNALILYIVTVLTTGGVLLGLALSHALAQDEVNILAGLYMGHVFTMVGGVAAKVNGHG
jgi:hypothetical protein